MHLIGSLNQCYIRHKIWFIKGFGMVKNTFVIYKYYKYIN